MEKMRWQCPLGDGSAEEGVLHESLNLAASMKLPVVYICENNLFSSHLHISLRQPADSIARYADAHRIPTICVDGNDVAELYHAAEEGIRICREGNGPVFIEAITYRWRGHVGPSEDIDVGVQRKDGLAVWKMRDPINRLWRAIETDQGSTSERLDAIWKRHREECNTLWQKAVQADYPADQELLDRVYTNLD